jgi:hypothetical protein
MRVFPGPRYKWKRVLLKVSGAALAAAPTSASAASAPHNVDPKVSSSLLFSALLLFIGDAHLFIILLTKKKYKLMYTGCYAPRKRNSGGQSPRYPGL